MPRLPLYRLSETEAKTEPYTQTETELSPESDKETSAPMVEEIQWVLGDAGAESSPSTETKLYSEPESYAEPETEPLYEWDTYAETEPELETETVITDNSELSASAYFWAPTGNKVHTNPNCRSFKSRYIFAGTLEEA